MDELGKVCWYMAIQKLDKQCTQDRLAELEARVAILEEQVKARKLEEERELVVYGASPTNESCSTGISRV
jgi:hypothetical protein